MNELINISPDNRKDSIVQDTATQTGLVEILLNDVEKDSHLFNKFELDLLKIIEVFIKYKTTIHIFPGNLINTGKKFDHFIGTKNYIVGLEELNKAEEFTGGSGRFYQNLEDKISDGLHQLNIEINSMEVLKVGENFQDLEKLLNIIGGAKFMKEILHIDVNEFIEKIKVINNRNILDSKVKIIDNTKPSFKL